MTVPVQIQLAAQTLKTWMIVVTFFNLYFFIGFQVLAAKWSNTAPPFRGTQTCSGGWQFAIL